MIRYLKTIFVLLLTISLFCRHTAAQPGGLSSKEQEAIVHKIADLIKTHYVSVEKGAAIAQHLVKTYQDGAFNKATDNRVFDSLMTTTLQAYSHDGHLFVRHDTAIVNNILAAEKDAATPEGEDLFYYGADAAKKNYGFQEIRILEGNIGYIKLSEINISGKSLPVLCAAMQLIANTTALIIDLRYNGGGGTDIGAVFESFFLPANTPLLEFKDRKGHVEVDKTVSWLQQQPYKQPLFIAVNKRTASAAEAFAYVLQAHKRAKVIGQPTAGAANWNTYYAVNPEIFVSISTAAPVLPGTDKTWEQKGIQPDYITLPGAELEQIHKLVHQ